MKKTLALLLAVVMVLAMFPLTSLAAAGEPNVTISVNTTEANVGDTITVKIGITEMTASSIAFGFDFNKDLLKATSVTKKPKFDYTYYDEDEGWIDDDTNATSVSTVDEANASGHIGVVLAGATEEKYLEKNNIVTIKFEALANGTVNFEMFEDSGGTDGYKGEWISDVTVQIGPSTPACEHTSTKPVSNNNGTHNVVCTNEECKAVVTENVPCSDADGDGDHNCDCGYTVGTCTAGEPRYSQGTENGNHYKFVDCAECDINISKELESCAGGNATCEDPALCAKCGLNYGESLDHIDENPKDHKCDYGCGTAMGTHADGDDKDHTCDYCQDKVEGETCTEGEPVKNTEKSTDATCTEGGTLVEDIFCTECGEFIRSITTALDPTCTTGTASYTWGTDNATCKAQLVCEHGTVLKEEEVTATSKITTEADCQTNEVITYTADFTADWAADQSLPVTGGVNPDKHIGDAYNSYKNNGNNTHTEVWTYDVCGHSVDGAIGECSGGTATCQDLPVCGVCDKAYGQVDENNHIGDATVSYKNNNNGTHTEVNTYECGHAVNCAASSHEYDNHVCVCNAKFTGWDNGAYYVEAVMQTGWTEIEDAWYYLNPETGIPAKGLSRVPYPTSAINGITYEADAETLEYCATKNKTFIDATEAWFVFGDDGKFNQTSGLIDGKYAVKGMLAWHPGLVVIDGETYYFIGDETNGGNIGANGDTYITRNNGIEGFVKGDIFNFVNGELSGLTGIKDGKYYENSRLMVGNGLTETANGIIYVRTSGQVATGTYYISNLENYTGDALQYGDKLVFDENGYALEGIVDGKYYVNGKLAYNAGVVEVEADKYIYVRSNGEVVMGKDYWITNVGTSGVVAKSYTFDENGYFTPEFVADQKNGVVDGYYYENGNIVYGAGLIEYNGGIIYVRSNGQVATGKYWVTTTNGLMEAGCYTFGEDGMMIN